MFKLLRQNLDNNAVQAKSKIHASRSSSKSADPLPSAHSNIDVLALDWETSDPSSLPLTLSTSPEDFSLDAVVACDCIYNEALIEPFVRTCADLCRLSSDGSTVCVIAQQLRSHEVFEAWLTVFMKMFKVWRFSDELLAEDLREGKGFVVHLGVLRKANM